MSGVLLGTSPSTAAPPQAPSVPPASRTASATTAGRSVNGLPPSIPSGSCARPHVGQSVEVLLCELSHQLAERRFLNGPCSCEVDGGVGRPFRRLRARRRRHDRDRARAGLRRRARSATGGWVRRRDVWLVLHGQNSIGAPDGSHRSRQGTAMLALVRILVFTATCSA